jgi:Zn-dependent peptidase ImmA (M78 family)
MQTLSKQHIKNLAADVRNILRIEDVVLQKPFLTQNNAEIVISALGGKLHQLPFNEWNSDWGDGYIRVNNNSNDEQNFDLKVYRDRFPPERNIFTIAHELGHLFLHLHYGTEEWTQAQEEFKDASWNRKGFGKTENEADYFAACFLMPENEFISEWTMQNSDTERVAKAFGVSKTATNVRARSLGLI